MRKILASADTFVKCDSEIRWIKHSKNAQNAKKHKSRVLRFVTRKSRFNPKGLIKYSNSVLLKEILTCSWYV